MRTLALLAVLTVAALAFAGCTANKDKGTSSSSSSSHSASGSVSASVSVSASASSTKTSSSSSSTGPAANHAPTGSISASAGNGSLPLKVNFTLSGTDQDHDALVWALTFGDGNKTNGTTLPSTASHSYTKAGNFTAVFTLTDGKSPTSYNVTIKVKGGAAGGQPVAFSGSTTASSAACPQVSADFLASVGAPVPAPFDPYPAGTPLEGQEWLKFDVTPAAGKPYVADSSFTSPAVFGDSLDFYDASGAQVASHGDGTGHFADLVPADASFAVAYPCGPGPYTITFAA